MSEVFSCTVFICKLSSVCFDHCYSGSGDTGQAMIQKQMTLASSLPGRSANLQPFAGPCLSILSHFSNRSRKKIVWNIVSFYLIESNALHFS